MAKQQGPSKAELDAIRKSLKEIEQLYIKLGGINPFKGMDPKKIASSVDEVTRLRNELQDARDAVSDMEGEAGDLFKSWRAITDEVKGHRKVINDSKSTVSQINDLSQKLKDHHNKINALSSKDLNTIKSKLEQQKSVLKTNQDSLQSTIDELKLKQQIAPLTATELSQLREAESIQRNINGSLERNEGLLDSIINKAEQEAKARKEIETSLGATGGILKGLSKIPLIKDVVDTEKVLKASNDEIEISKSGIKGLGAGFKEIGGQIKSGLLNPANLALGFITQMTAALKATDEGAGKLAKDFNLTYSEALNVRRELGNIAATSMDAALNTKNLQETLTFVGAQLGSNAKLNEADLKTFTKLREQAGYTNEELYGIQQMSLLNGKSLEQNTKEILGGAQAYASRNKLVINEKQVLRDVSKASASLKLTLGGSAEAVAEAAVRARQFGLNLEQAEKISQSLLQFESSIESELSAELLTGRDLNFERARGLALNGETAKAAEEIAKQVGTSAEFAKMNVIQQEAIAKAAGMERNELAQSLMDREALAKLSGVEGATAQERFNNLVKEVGMEEAKKRLGDEQLATQYEQQSVQERFAQAVEKLQEVFVQLAEPILAILSPLMNIVTNVLPAINFALSPLIEGFSLIGDLVGMFVSGLKEGQPIIVGLTAALVAMKAQAIMTAIFSVFESFAKIPFGLGIPLAITTVAGMVSLASSSAKKGDDVLSPGGSGGGYGKRTLLGPEGAIQLNDKDTVIAGTNLFDKADDMVSSPKGSVTVSNKTAPKKETPVDTNAGTNARLDALIAMTGKVNSISTLKVQ
jgi:predicted  nucleic acid-binding Zn-ribbon protein